MTLARAALLCVFAAPALAQPGPIGVAECDTFIAAYQTCARTPGLPDDRRATVQEGVDTLTTTLKTQAGRWFGRGDMSKECLQLHATLRRSMVASYKCDFPTNAAVTAADATQQADGASPEQSAERQRIAKENAYTATQNNFLARYKLSSYESEYLTDNRAVLTEGAKLPASPRFFFPVPTIDTATQSLADAVALPGTVPDIDPAANTLLAAMQTLAPIVSKLERYQTTQAYEDDHFKLARETTPAFLAALKATVQAAAAYQRALGQHEIARDQARIKSLPEGSLEQRLVQTSLAARGTVTAYRDLTRSNTAPFAEALGTLNTVGGTLAEAVKGADSACVIYSSGIDRLVGEGRDLLREMRGTSDPSRAAEGFISQYNTAVDDLNRCQRYGMRAGR